MQLKYLYLRRFYIIAVAQVFYLNNLKKLSRIGECMVLFQKVKKHMSKYCIKSTSIFKTLQLKFKRLKILSSRKISICLHSGSSSTFAENFISYFLACRLARKYKKNFVSSLLFPSDSDI